MGNEEVMLYSFSAYNEVWEFHAPGKKEIFQREYTEIFLLQLMIAEECGLKKGWPV